MTPERYIKLQQVSMSDWESQVHDEVQSETTISGQDSRLANITRSRMSAGELLMPRSTVSDELQAAGLNEGSSLEDLSAFAKEMKLDVTSRNRRSDELFRVIGSELAWKRADKRMILGSSGKWSALKQLLDDIWKGKLGTQDFAAPPSTQPILPEDQLRSEVNNSE